MMSCDLRNGKQSVNWTPKWSRGPLLVWSMGSLSIYNRGTAIISSFFNFFGGRRLFLWAHWYPCFGLLVMSPLGFKVRVGSLIRAWERSVIISRCCCCCIYKNVFITIHWKWIESRERLNKFCEFIFIFPKCSIVQARPTVCCVNIEYSYIDPEVRFSSSQLGLIYTANSPV